MVNTTSTIAFSGGVKNQEWFIIAASVVSIIFGLINAAWILKIEIVSKDEEVMALRDDKMMGKLQEM
jgi:uncharacterized membrane protein